jgi:hypothetical protein
MNTCPKAVVGVSMLVPCNIHGKNHSRNNPWSAPLG